MINEVTYPKELQLFITSYDKSNYRIWDQTTGEMSEIRKHIKQHYLLAQGYRCAYCRMQKKEKHGATWDVEHILPKSIFPQFLFEPQNLVTACKECNSNKDAFQVLVSSKTTQRRYPSKSEHYKIMHPHYDKFDDHFEITEVCGKRRIRPRNEGKAKATYIACNFVRFDYAYSEWDSFDHAILDKVSEWLDKCGPTSTVADIRKMMGFLTCEISGNF